MNDSIVVNEMASEEFEKREKELLESMRRDLFFKRERNSFLEPFEAKKYDERGWPAGVSRIRAKGRCKFGTFRLVE